MTLYEILNFNKELLQRLQSVGAKTEDCRYIELYAEYTKMKGAGDKVTYIVSVLAEKYDISVRNVYNIVRRFEKHCTDVAV